MTMSKIAVVYWSGTGNTEQMAAQVAEEVKRYFPGKVYATVIPRNVRLSEAPSHGKPITGYDRSSRGYEAYMALADEFLRKTGDTEKGEIHGR